ncbi:MAG: response regulator transcription factor [Ghiorsea sp.]
MQALAILVDEDADHLKKVLRVLNGNDHIKVVGVAKNYRDAVIAIRELKPDIMLTDLELQDGTGLDLIREARKIHPKLQSIIVTDDVAQSSLFAALGVGAKGYILKDTLHDLIHYLNQLLGGGSPISPYMARWLVDNYRDNHQTVEGKPILSRQELEMLTLLSKGCSREEMARLSGISLNTVATYIKRIYTKLGVSSKTEAVFEAVQLGLIRIQRGSDKPN